MIRFLYGQDLHQYPRLGDTMFTDRAWQFQDRLGWNVDVDAHGLERDEYDTLNPLYVIWQTASGRHAGSMRFLPTTGRTMVNEHFLDATDGVRIEDPLIWECTRFCVSQGGSGRIAAALMLAGGELMRRQELSHFVGVFDAPMLRVYRAIGASPTVIGTAGQAREGVSVGLWAFSYATQCKLAMRAGVSPALVSLWFDRSFGDGLAAASVA